MQCDGQMVIGLLLTIMVMFACPFLRAAVAFDACALEQLRKTDGNTASFLIVANPARNLKYGLRATFTELAPLMADFAKGIPEH